MEYRKPRLSIEETERALLNFLDGRGDLPRMREFDQAGQGRLYQAMLDHGGPAFWNQRLSLSSPSPPSTRTDLARQRFSLSEPASPTDRAAPKSRDPLGGQSPERPLFGGRQTGAPQNPFRR